MSDIEKLNINIELTVTDRLKLSLLSGGNLDINNAVQVSGTLGLFLLTEFDYALERQKINVKPLSLEQLKERVEEERVFMQSVIDGINNYPES